MLTETASAHHAHDHHHEEAGATKVFGFWLYLMTDCVLFASLFAAFAVLRHAYAGGPTGRELFDLKNVAIETACLLVSSVTYGFAMMGAHRGSKGMVIGWLAITFVLGAGFVGLEVTEFHQLIADGNGPQRSAFLSAFFALVSTHGGHVSFGLLWMAVLVFQLTVLKKDLTPNYVSRLAMLSLFWHFLDIVWICVFTVVYLMGVL